MNGWVGGCVKDGRDADSWALAPQLTGDLEDRLTVLPMSLCQSSPSSSQKISFSAANAHFPPAAHLVW
jgi:hypothetical protein